MAEQIRVGEELHQKVEKIATANYRGMKDQIEYWADHDCPHPADMRENMNVQVPLPSKGKHTDHALRIFYCNQCGHYIVMQDTDFQNVKAALAGSSAKK